VAVGKAVFRALVCIPYFFKVFKGLAKSHSIY
jgi:hypothetical protein